jgi:hypothetical protein
MRSGYRTLHLRCRAVVVALASFVALGVSPDRVTAQTYWRIPAALGGALVGAGGGWMVDVARAAGEGVISPDLIATPIGLGLGGVLGFIGGHGADRRLARGDSLSRGARVTLRMATFLAPVAAGSAIAFAIINPSDEPHCVPSSDPNGCTYEPPRKIASDEAVLVAAIGGGAVLGWIAQQRFARALHPRARVGVAPTGRGVVVSVPVGW